MKKYLLLAALFTMQAANVSMIKETIYSGKLDQQKLNTALIVSKFYPVMLKKDKGASFEYAVRPELKNEDFNAGIYKATAFTILPSISSKAPLSLKINSTQVGGFTLNGEKISFQMQMNIDELKIGTINYEFDMYQLPIKRIYNPKVTRDLESSATGFNIVENREMN